MASSSDQLGGHHSVGVIGTAQHTNQAERQHHQNETKGAGERLGHSPSARVGAASSAASCDTMGWLASRQW
jgi:hypothetical protein